MTYKLIDIGREKVNRTVEVKDLEQLEQEVRKHLMSNEVRIVFGDDDCFSGCVFVGFFRPAGVVERVT